MRSKMVHPVVHNMKAVIVLVAALLAAGIAMANGGDQRVVDGKYLINLSRSPFTPRAGERVALLASWVDLATGKLIAEDLLVKIRIAKLGGGGGKREFLYEQENVRVKGGVVEFSYTFNGSGLHEIFFDFAFASNPSLFYEAPDFLLDVQKPAVQGAGSNVRTLAGIGVGLAVGLGLGWLLSRKAARQA